MEDLFVASIVFGPPAVMLLVAQACRLGLNRLVASLVVLIIMAAAASWFWSGVTETYAKFGVSEGNGAFAFFCLAVFVYLLGAVASLVMILLMKNVRSAGS